MQKEQLLDLLADRLVELYHERADVLHDPHRGDLFRFFLQARRLDLLLTDREIREAVARRIEHARPALLGLLRDFGIMWSAWRYCGAHAEIGLEHWFAAVLPDARPGRTP